jgi:hypothetical protein
MNHIDEEVKRLRRPVDLVSEARAGPLDAHRIVNFLLKIVFYGALKRACCT